MASTFQLSSGRIAAFIVAITFEILMPLVLALIVRRRLGVGWRYFGYGALIFFLFQMISRVPLVTAIQAAIAPQLQASRGLQIAWGLILAVTAGLFEEVGRYIGYRWLMRREEKTWEKAIMYGLGHGGIESMVLIGGLALATLISLISISVAGIDSLPEAQRALAAQQLAAINAQPDWLPLLGAWERLWSVAFHVSLSVVVLQVFRRGSMRWLWLAVVAHALLDLVAVGVPMLGLDQLTALIVIEIIVAVAGLIGLWVIRALREPPVAEPLLQPAQPDAAPAE